MLSIFFDGHAALLPRVMQYLSYKDVSRFLSVSREANRIWKPVIVRLKRIIADKEWRAVLMRGSPSSRFIANLDTLSDISLSFWSTYPPNRRIRIDNIWPSAPVSAPPKTKRIESELNALWTMSYPFVSPMGFIDDGALTIKFAMIGTEDVFHGEVFHFLYRFSSNHPYQPPTVRLMTPVPGIPDGDLGIDMLSDRWSPIMTVSRFIVSIQSVMNSHDLECFRLPARVRGEDVAAPVHLGAWDFMYNN